VLPRANIQLLKGEVIAATRRRRPRPIWTRSLFSASFARPVTKVKLCFLAIIYKTMLFVLKINIFAFFHIQPSHVFASTLSGFH
jgi:hypothetical protein